MKRYIFYSIAGLFLLSCHDNTHEVQLQDHAHRHSAGGNIVFDHFPTEKELYTDDLRTKTEKIIETYGHTEWRACVLTNEMHGHLGSYSIIGAKMGIKAREILNADIDRLNVISYAGSTPPLSCLNDGLQISTGATLGTGKIQIIKDSISEPVVIFYYNDKKIKMILKKEIQDKIENDIREGIARYGNLTEGYWDFIRKVSIKHWLELDRNVIFDIFEE